MILSGKTKRVDVLGAGGHARAVIALLERCEYGVDGVYDESYNPAEDELIGGVRLRGLQPSGSNKIVMAIGDGAKRAMLFERIGEGVLLANIMHPNCIKDKDVVIGKANIIMAGVILNAEVQIGDNNILNSGCIIEHESSIGDHNHISVGAVVCGRVKIGNHCFIGAGATIIDRITICSDVVIGAGSVVIRDIVHPGTYVGNPAKKIK